MNAAYGLDPEADAIEYANLRLLEWGQACRCNSERLGLPQVSGISRMIEHVRREDRLRRGVRKKAVTAHGSQTKSFRPSSVVMNSKVLEVDGIVAKLPGWMQATIKRRYLFGQPDRLACRELRVPRDVYRLRVQAAIEWVADRL